MPPFALPAALAATFGKIAISGVGTGGVSTAAIPLITSLFMKDTTANDAHDHQARTELHLPAEIFDG